MQLQASWLRGASHSGEQHNTSSCFPNGEIIQVPITEAAHFHENYKDLLSQTLLLICQIQVKFASGFDAYQRHTDRFTISHTNMCKKSDHMSFIALKVENKSHELKSQLNTQMFLKIDDPVPKYSGKY